MTLATSYEELRNLAQDPTELHSVIPVVGCYEHVVANIGNFLGCFDKASIQPEVGVPTKVMITGVMYHYAPNDTDKVRYLFLRVVTDDMVLVRHEGFQKRGFFKACTATTMIDGRLVTLTPGRTSVRAADMTVVVPIPEVPMPGYAYVFKSDIEEWRRRVAANPQDNTPIRIEGLISHHDLHPTYRRSIMRMRRGAGRALHRQQGASDAY